MVKTDNTIKSKVQDYIDGALDGSIVTGNLVRLAVERHIKDLETGKDRRLNFDEAAATRVCRFFERFLKHSKGEWAGQPFVLSGWQAFIIWVVYGWKNEDGYRRFRFSYKEIGRKNGKSTLEAGIGCYLTFADDEAGAEVYTAATKRDQARIVHSEAVRMVKQSPGLRKWTKVFKNNISVERTNSKYEPLGADDDTMDGLNPHGAIIDELHAHKSRGVWDVLVTAVGSRKQPLIDVITTAGFDRTSICWEQHEYSEKVLKGVIQDDTWFAFIASIDEGDDWQDEGIWGKANPNLEISVSKEYLAQQAHKAKESPQFLNTFLRLHLNVWTQQFTRWINLDVWNEQAGSVIESELYRRRCYGGLDLSAVSDLTAWVMVFPHNEDPESVDILARFWCPEARLYDRQNKYRDHYQTWAREGFLNITPGDAIDYGFVKEQIIQDNKQFNLVDMNIDRLFQGYQLAMELADFIGEKKVVTMGMGFLSMAAPMKDFESRLLKRKLHHGGNPIMKWMADNVAVSKDAAGNLKPDKANSQGKIDGIVALVMALDRASRHKEVRSVYEERGILVF